PPKAVLPKGRRRVAGRGRARGRVAGTEGCGGVDAPRHRPRPAFARWPGDRSSLAPARTRGAATAAAAAVAELLVGAVDLGHLARRGRGRGRDRGREVGGVLASA